MELNFDLNNVDAYGTNLELPPGQYHVMVNGIEYKEDKYGEGYLNVQYLVLDGDFKNRSHYELLYVFSSQENRRMMAYKRLKGLAIAIGHPSPGNIRNTDTLVGRDLMIKIKHTPKKDNPADYYVNVSNYLPVPPTAVAPMATPSAAAAMPPAAPQNPGSMPPPQQQAPGLPAGQYPF